MTIIVMMHTSQKNAKDDDDNNSDDDGNNEDGTVMMVIVSPFAHGAWSHTSLQNAWLWLCMNLNFEFLELSTVKRLMEILHTQQRTVLHDETWHDATCVLIHFFNGICCGKVEILHSDWPAWLYFFIQNWINGSWSEHTTHTTWLKLWPQVMWRCYSSHNIILKVSSTFIFLVIDYAFLLMVILIGWTVHFLPYNLHLVIRTHCFITSWPVITSFLFTCFFEDDEGGDLSKYALDASDGEDQDTGR